MPTRRNEPEKQLRLKSLALVAQRLQRVVAASVAMTPMLLRI
jgi:hypothetical protein